jgi:hypothetical protein
MSHEKLANYLLALSYGDMMDLADDLADAIADKEVWPTFGTKEDFAILLHGWADANGDAATIAKAESGK